MSTARALFFITLIWAGIFLPGLGSTEIKGEEGRRIMLGVEMLQDGDWLVPHYNGRAYLRKPPLVNWLIAFSIKTFHAKNEWTARLPSVLAVLALALTIVGVGSGWLGAETALIAAIFSITNIGLIEKGRLAEIEAVYIALFGIAMTCWLSWWQQKKSPWLVWIVPSIFLGLGLLAKAPVHLLFFYAIVVPVLVRERRARELLRLPHFVGIVLMLAIFLAWAVPYFRATAGLNAAGVWASQMEERVGGGSFDWKGWLENFPRALGNFLPWLIFLPLLWNRATMEKLAAKNLRDAEILKAARWPVVICFFGLVLLHSQFLPRYTLPMLTPASLLLAMVFKTRFGEKRALRWTLGAGIFAAACMIVFAVAIVPRMNARAGVRAFAQRINENVPTSETLCIFKPEIFPPAFYIRSRVVYAYSTSEIPSDADFVLVSRDAFSRHAETWRSSRVAAELTDKNKNQFFLLQRRANL